MVGLEVLRKSDLLKGLSDSELIEIAKMAREATFEVGVAIFRENDSARDLYIVREGRVALLIDIGRNKQTVIENISRNGSFGWSAMVPPYTFTSAARTLEHTRLIVLAGHDLREFCRTHCSICFSIMENITVIISNRLRDSRLQLINLLNS